MSSGREQEPQQADQQGGENTIANTLNIQQHPYPILSHHHPDHQQQPESTQMHHQVSDHALSALAAAAGPSGAMASAGGFMFPDPPQILPWSIPPAAIQSFNPAHFPIRDHDPFLFSPPSSSSSSSPSPSSSCYNAAAAGFSLTRRTSPSGHPFLHGFGYDIGCPSSSTDQLRILSDSLGPVVQLPGSAPFNLQAELSKMTAQEIMDAKALAASKSHSEAERRRRERINNHLAKLRSILPSNTKTDKASLLAEVIQHVKELKRQTSLILETSCIPTETDELTVTDISEYHDEQQQLQLDGNSYKFVIKASLCCEDRPDLLADLIKSLKSLRLKTLKAEITTLGGRVKYVLFITGDGEPSSNEGDHGRDQWSISSIQEALKAVMEKPGAEDSASGSAKRQRTNITNMLV